MFDLFNGAYLYDYLQSSRKPIVLYGMGNGADKIIKVLESKGIAISGVFSSDGFVRNKTFHGFNIKSFSQITDELGDVTVLVCFGTQRDEVIENIKNIAGCRELFVPDVPVYGEGLFDKSYVEQNYEKLCFVYEHLADEQSKKVFENCVKFRLSGKPQYLFDCETDEAEAFDNILRLSENESYLDLGAYKGDTIEKFIKAVSGSYSAIYAVEPDKKSFARLSAFCGKLDNCTLFNCAIGSRTEKAFLKTGGGRNTCLDKSGAEVDVDTVDNILSGKSVSFIKADVEGEELPMLKGAYNTITACKPKMLISAYHRNGDYIDIPLEVLKIRSDYKVYMRHHKYLPAWDTNYYFV